MISLRRQRSTFSGGGYLFVLMSLHMAYYTEDHQNITSCRNNPWESLWALLYISQSSVGNQRKESGAKSNESHLFPCKVWTGHSLQEDQTSWIDSGGGLCAAWTEDEKCFNQEINQEKNVYSLSIVPFFEHFLYCPICYFMQNRVPDSNT